MRKKVYLFLFVLFLACSCELLVIANSKVSVVFDTQGDLESIFNVTEHPMSVIGYEQQEGNKYVPIASDPQLLISNICRDVESVGISFSEPLEKDTFIQVFFRTSEFNFCEEESLWGTAEKGSISYLFDCAVKDCIDVRIDINGVVAIEDVLISDENISCSTYHKEQFFFARFFVFTLVAGIVVFLLMKWNSSKSANKLTKLELIYCFACFVYYFIWALSKPFNYGPDEYMRYDVSLFLYSYNRLPRGIETINGIWGYSYAHLPTMLCNILSYFPMKIVSVFWKADEFALLIAARSVSVVCGTGVVYFTFKIAKCLFITPIHWIMVVFLSTIPQFAFLCSYVNNDIVALLGCAIILYAWSKALTEKWNYKIAILLAVGIVICGLTYYNSYGWILCSIVFFAISYLIQYKRDYKGFFMMGGFISAIVLVGASYLFVRHLVLYGDLLGFNTTDLYNEIYALEEYKISNRTIFQNAGIELREMLFGEYNWLYNSYRSAIGVFGYMNVYVSEYIFKIYLMLIAIGVGGCVWNLVICVKKKQISKQAVLYYVCNIVCIVIPVCLSIYRSYTHDFQPQGRYCYPGVIACVLLLTKGFDRLLERWKDKKEYIYGIVGIYTGLFVAISISEFFVTYLPS